MDGKMIGKIKNVDIITEYGHIYVHFEFGSDKECWGVANAYPIQPGLKAKEPDKWKLFQIATILEAAKVEKLSHLKGKPVEVTFEHNTLKDWRILEEAI